MTKSRTALCNCTVQNVLVVRTDDPRRQGRYGGRRRAANGARRNCKTSYLVVSERRRRVLIGAGVVRV